MAWYGTSEERSAAIKSGRQAIERDTKALADEVVHMARWISANFPERTFKFVPKRKGEDDGEIH